MTDDKAMTLRADLAALLDDAGIIDVDLDKAVADEHVRAAAYQRIIAVAAASTSRDGDRALLETILRDPEPLTAKTAAVELVDKIAQRSTDPAEFEQWAAALAPSVDLLATEGDRRFVHQRIRDWLLYLSIKAGHTPTPAELADVSDWMQRTLAEVSTSVPTLTLLAEHGRTKKIRNVAKNRS